MFVGTCAGLYIHAVHEHTYYILLLYGRTAWEYIIPLLLYLEVYYQVSLVHLKYGYEACTPAGLYILYIHYYIHFIHTLYGV